MPRKIRELIADLKKAGFKISPGKGSHRKFTHASGAMSIVAGGEGDDAKPYQEKEIRAAIAAAKKKD